MVLGSYKSLATRAISKYARQLTVLPLVGFVATISIGAAILQPQQPPTHADAPQPRFYIIAVADYQISASGIEYRTPVPQTPEATPVPVSTPEPATQEASVPRIPLSGDRSSAEVDAAATGTPRPIIKLPVPTVPSTITSDPGPCKGYDCPRVVEWLLPIIHKYEDMYNIPRGIIAAMTIWESSGGVAACGYNLTGWRSCNGRRFVSWEDGIETTASELSSYDGDLVRKLCTWVGGERFPSPCSYATDRVIPTSAQFR